MATRRTRVPQHTALAQVYLTHNAAIARVLADPAPLIAQLLAKAAATGIHGFDIDYEPQAEVGDPTFAVTLMAFLTTLAEATTNAGLLLTIDVGGCPAFHDFMCAGIASIPGLTQVSGRVGGLARGWQGPVFATRQLASLSCDVAPAHDAPRRRVYPQVNTMDSFGVRTVAQFQQQQRANQPALGSRWAPGFEPGGIGQAGLTTVLAYAATANVTALSTWAVHEANVGDQPQWLFDAVNAFLDAP